MQRRHLFATSLLVGLCATLSSFAALASQPAARVPHGLAFAPPGLAAAFARTEARVAARDSAYAIGEHGCASLETGPKAAPLTGCFGAAGAAFTNGKQRIGLHLAAWGRAGRLRAVRLTRTTARANRIAYQGRDIGEWWRVLPMGYEQGFAIAKAPAGRSEVVLQLRADRAPEVGHDTLAWGRVRYGKLYVTDATGKALPAHLTAHGKTITLAFDASDARYPISVDPLVWTEQQTLTASDGAAGDQFGASVALSTDGGTALIGAPYKTVGANNSQGTAYIYTLSGGQWKQAAELTASDGAQNDEFGMSVALDSTGVTALVGADCAPFDTVANACGPGAVYVFTKSAGGWATTSHFDAKLVEGTGVDADRFGAAVALSSDGATALVGAYCASASVSAGVTTCGTGFAYIFVRPAAGWGTASTPSLLNQTLAMVASSANVGAYFGWSVALSGDGATALVGTDNETVAGNAGQGAAYVFNTTDNWATYNQAAELTASDGVSGDELGFSVALSYDGTTALAGADCAPYGTGCGQGVAYVFT